ncbi:MAG: hypothetical protein K8R54_12205 [Bacteroidales bacterium]|nr:hypothetical protein [Bacteroidales bacterium]
MNNIYNKTFDEKDKLLSQQSEKEDSFSILQHIIENGKVVYLYPDFNFEAFASSVKLYLHNELKQETNSQNINDTIIEIKYFSPESIANKLNVASKFKLLLLQYENLLYFNIDLSETTDNPEEKPSKISLSSFLNDSYKKELSVFIYEKIYSNYSKKNPEKKLDFNNIFIEETHLNERLFIHNITEKETVLCKLNISSFKSDDTNKFKDIENSSFIVSDSDICAVAFNKKGELLYFESLSQKFNITKRIGKNAINYGTITWYPKRSNSALFNDLKNIQDFIGNSRIREVARLCCINEDYSTAENFFLLLSEKEKNPFNLLSLLFIKSKKNQDSVEKYISEIDFRQMISEILNTEDSERRILELFENWDIDYNDKITFLQLFAGNADNAEEKEKILPFYENIRTEFKKKNKDIINQTVFDINYSEFLINSGYKRKAVRILKKLLKKLPDETVSDLLPSKTLNLTGNKSGQLLKITIFDLITKAKGQEDSAEEIQKTVQLQPLNFERLNNLAASRDKDLKKKAADIITILNKDGLFGNTLLNYNSNYNSLPEKIINNTVRHPATLKKGSFYSVQKWLSKMKEDDYSNVINYSEKITNKNYKDLFELLENIRDIFNINDIEYFVSKGERSIGIIGYEGNPPFVVFGHNHLNENSDLYLNMNELQFIIASEFAHIYFKHSKITSQDVWRGVADKGSFLIDALLAVVPAAGIVGKSIKNLQKLSGLTKIIRTSNQVVSNVKNAYDAALKVTDFYRKKIKTSSKNEKEQKLLAASRLMQFTADRAGMAVSGNLKSAVRSIFITGKYNFGLFDEAKNTSLKELILKENNDGSFKNQELAVRLANLFSFYISDDYQQIRKMLTEK